MFFQPTIEPNGDGTYRVETTSLHYSAATLPEVIKYIVEEMLDLEKRVIETGYKPAPDRHRSNAAAASGN